MGTEEMARYEELKRLGIGLTSEQSFVADWPLVVSYLDQLDILIWTFVQLTFLLAGKWH